MGDELIADGAAVRLWRLAQEHWKQNAEPIPNYKFEHVRFSSELVRAGLAYVRDSSVYVRGCSNAFAWMTKNVEKARNAGKKSAETRRLKNGTAQPLNYSNGKITELGPNSSSNNLELNPTKPELNPTKAEQDSTWVNLPEPSLSLSSSSSLSESLSESCFKNKNGAIRTDYPEDFIKIWDLYGKKGDKKASFEEFKRLRLSPEEYQNLCLAISNVLLRKERQYMKDFERYLKTDWREDSKTSHRQIYVYP